MNCSTVTFISKAYCLAGARIAENHIWLESWRPSLLSLVHGHCAGTTESGYLGMIPVAKTLGLAIGLFDKQPPQVTKIVV